MTEPIIPVRRHGVVDGWWQQTVECAHVDAAVNVDVPSTEADVAARSLGLPLVNLADIDRPGPACWTSHWTALPSSGDGNSPVLGSVGSPLWEAVAAGDLTEDHERQLADAGLEVAFRRERMPDQLARAVLRRGTVLDRSIEAFGELSTSGGAGAIPAIVWLTAPNGFLDCLWYWNLRALRSVEISPAPMVLVPKNEVQHWLGFPEQLHGVLARPAEFDPDVLIAGMNASRNEMDALAALLGLQPTRRPVRTGWRPRAAVRTPPFTYATMDVLDPRPWFTGERRYGQLTEFEAHFRSGRGTLRFPSPVHWQLSGLTLLQLRSPLLDGLPKKPVLSNLITTNGSWRDDSIQIATAATNQYLLELRIPSASEAIEAVISACSVDHAVSDKGKLGMALVANDSDLLAPGVYEAALALATPRSKEFARQLAEMLRHGELDERAAELAATWGGRSQRRYRSARQLGWSRAERAAAALERLCAMGWAERGFELACRSCGLASFVPLHETDAAASCPGCASREHYSTAQDGPVSYYRLNTLADRAVDQGVLPHLLVAAALKERSAQTELLPGVELTLETGEKTERDLVGIHGGDFVVGEVKTSPGEFNTDQIERDVRLSALLGADVHVMAAVGAMPDSAVAKARDLTARAGIELLLLTDAELRPAPG